MTLIFGTKDVVEITDDKIKVNPLLFVKQGPYSQHFIFVQTYEWAK
jgi:hypothetical protein